MTNPHDRSWLQTGGMPVDAAHAAMRRELDRTDSVEWIGGGAFKLYSSNGAKLGIVQFQVRADAVDDDVLKSLAREEAGETPAVDPSKGDTVVRPLDMDNPDDRAMVSRLMSAPKADAVIGDDGAPLDPTTPPVKWPRPADITPVPQHVGGMPQWLAVALIVFALVAASVAVAAMIDVLRDSDCRIEAMNQNRSDAAC